MNKDVEKYLQELKEKLDIVEKQKNTKQIEIYRAKIKTANKIIHLYESNPNKNNFGMDGFDYKW